MTDLTNTDVLALVISCLGLYLFGFLHGIEVGNRFERDK